MSETKGSAEPSAPDDDALPEHVKRNRASWDAMADKYVAEGERRWADDAPRWGIWGVPETEARVLPESLAGRRAIELGCGTGYVSAWMTRRGASVVGVDNSPRQLETARRLQREHGLEFPLLLGNAESVPFEDASFDFAISEYGASIWADPYRWVPEAARLLRPGGELTFLVNGTLAMLTMPDREADGPAGERLLRPYFGMHRFEWADEESVEFHLGYGDWIRLLRANGFEVLDLIELRPAEDAATRYTYVTREWARAWPSEQVWKARKRA
jgi:SAM-dependent methyltransferase